MAKEFHLDILGTAKRTFKQAQNSFYRKTHLEINLVPDIKNEMIKAIKFRNLVFFLCIVIAAASVGVTAIFGSIMGGQQIAIDSKNGTIEKLSNKLNSYSDLGDYLTIKDQLDGVATITSNKNVLSRTFNILSAMLPTGADTITISEMAVDLEGDQPTFTFDAQANAGSEPYIDYNVLDSFKKSMEYLRYDYGNYVDKDGNAIPAYCMIESGSDGATFVDAGRKGLSAQDNNSIYAYWTIKEEGCKPDSTEGYTTENYDGKTVVKVWRTPQKSWYHADEAKDDEPSIGLDGTITNVPHFESACTTYSGVIEGDNQNNPTWTKTNDTCRLVPDGTDGIYIPESANGRDSDNQLVLRFSATITLAPEVYQFNNHHMLTVAPSGRHNVTDSYIQVQAMFGQRAAECEEGDSACTSNTTNSNGGN